jgi:hypothetical protein
MTSIFKTKLEEFKSELVLLNYQEMKKVVGGSGGSGGAGGGQGYQNNCGYTDSSGYFYTLEYNGQACGYTSDYQRTMYGPSGNVVGQYNQSNDPMLHNSAGTYFGQSGFNVGLDNTWANSCGCNPTSSNNGGGGGRSY